MVSEESRNTRRKNGRSRIRRRRDEDAMDIDESQLSRWRRFWEKGAKQAILTLLFAISVVFICFVGQDPPGLRTLGEVAPKTFTRIGHLTTLAKFEDERPKNGSGAAHQENFLEISLGRKVFQKH